MLLGTTRLAWRNIVITRSFSVSTRFSVRLGVGGWHPSSYMYQEHRMHKGTRQGLKTRRTVEMSRTSSANHRHLILNSEDQRVICTLRNARHQSADSDVQPRRQVTTSLALGGDLVRGDETRDLQCFTEPTRTLTSPQSLLPRAAKQRLSNGIILAAPQVAYIDPSASTTESVGNVFLVSYPCFERPSNS
jgi:hypothetical protein